MNAEREVFNENFEPGCLTQGLIWLVVLAFSICGIIGIATGHLTIPLKGESITIDGVGARVAGVGLLLCCVALVFATNTGIMRRDALKYGGILMGVGVAAIVIGKMIGT